MPISIELNKSTPASFQLVLPKIPTESSINATDELILNTYSAPLPGATLESEESRWEGGSIPISNGRITYDPWNYSFIVDEQMNNWKLLYNWMIYISNNKDKFFEYPNTYMVDATLRVLGNFQSEILVIQFIDLWPTTLGEVPLSYREAETTTECTVGFMYTRFEILR